MPGTPLEDCYNGDIVRNKKDADGITLSSISAAWLQARMIDQAGGEAGSVASGGIGGSSLQSWCQHRRASLLFTPPSH